MPHVDKVVLGNARLTEDQVNERLNLCNDTAIVDELYEQGKTLVKATIERIRSLESKAMTFVAYGSAIVTLLVSSSKSWSKLGNQWSPWIAFYASVCGLVCACLCFRVLSLRSYEVSSEDEWLKTECLTRSLLYLKQYRILTMWGTLESHIEAQITKSKRLRSAEAWLIGSVGYLVLLLFQLAFLHPTSNDAHRVSLGQGAVHQYLWIASWPIVAGSARLLSTLGDWGGILVLGLPLFLIYRLSRSH
jgi:hypothetical protein